MSKKIENQKLKRRSFASGALGALAVLGMSQSELKAAALPMTETEKANSKAVAAFLGAWEENPPKPEKIVSFLADNAVTKQGGTIETVVGRQANLHEFRDMTTGGRYWKFITDEEYVRGPVVLQYRRDIPISAEGKEGPTIYVVSIFLVKNGKITLWYDFGGRTPGTDNLNGI